MDSVCLSVLAIMSSELLSSLVFRIGLFLFACSSVWNGKVCVLEVQQSWSKLGRCVRHADLIRSQLFVICFMEGTCEEQFFFSSRKKDNPPAV